MWAWDTCLVGPCNNQALLMAKISRPTKIMVMKRLMEEMYAFFNLCNNRNKMLLRNNKQQKKNATIFLLRGRTIIIVIFYVYKNCKKKKKEKCVKLSNNYIIYSISVYRFENKFYKTISSIVLSRNNKYCLTSIYFMQSFCYFYTCFIFHHDFKYWCLHIIRTALIFITKLELQNINHAILPYLNIILL